MEVEEDYAQRISPVSSLRAILEAYPLSVGILRELVQNSDDAGASKQIFVLDCQSHSRDKLYVPGLAETQGPALLAFNDGVLKKEDWDALSSMHDSSKANDESKIGRYGIGFRSVFNITDCPQILSDTFLAIFDPLCRHWVSGGKKIYLDRLSSDHPDQLSPFAFFASPDPIKSPFRGTVIRCPLRTHPGRISEDVVQSDMIADLFREFIDKEIEIILLFLKNIKCIEIHEVTPTGSSTLLARSSIDRSEPKSIELYSLVFSATVELCKNLVTDRKKWQIIQTNRPREEATNLLMQQPGYNTSNVISSLRVAKFTPEIRIAVNLDHPAHGRLFTYLPLPISTGFPLHIHGLFGIDASRRYLRRPDDIGLQSGSRDHIKVQWNRLLFEHFIPKAWKVVLENIVSQNLVPDVFRFWPPQEIAGEVQTYCSSLSEKLLDVLITTESAVWPLYSTQSTTLAEIRRLESLVVVSQTVPKGVLDALTSMGLSLTLPPKYIFELVKKSPRNLTIICPEVAHSLLLRHVDQIADATEKEQAIVLGYLLSTRNVANICRLPLIPTASGSNASLTPIEPNMQFFHTLLAQDEFEVFGSCDDTSIPLHLLPRNVADALRDLGPQSLNVKTLEVSRIVEYLSQNPNLLNLCLSEVKTDPKAVRWLSDFWVWVDRYKHKDVLLPRIQNLFLLPSTNGLKKVDSTLFKLLEEHPTYPLSYLSVGIPFLAPGLSRAAHKVLESHGLVKRISDIPALLDALPLTTATPCPSSLECENILKHLGSNLSEDIGSERLQHVKRLPIFPILTFPVVADGGQLARNVPVTTWVAIPDGYSVRSVRRSTTFVPSVQDVSFVALDHIAPAIIRFLEPDHPRTLSEDDLVEYAVNDMSTQPEHVQVAVLEYVAQNRFRIPPFIMDMLRTKVFVLATDGSYRRPGDIVDPDSPISSLYLESGCYPARDTALQAAVVRHLKAIAFMKASLTQAIVKERIDFISSDGSIGLARNLLALLETSSMDFSRVQIDLEAKWLPTDRGLCGAKECRHVQSSSALFDKVLAVLDPPYRISQSFQIALDWDKPIPFEVLVKQLDLVLASEKDYDTVVEIIKEFGQRQCTDEEVASLEEIIRDRSWVPTTDRTLADTKSAVFKFSPTMLDSGFSQVKLDLKSEGFLRRMGCADTPSTRAIIDKLHKLAAVPNFVNTVGTSLSLLKSLPNDITPVDRAKLLIPDTKSLLRPSSRIFYNDIGDKLCLLSLDDQFIAHELVDESLARKLGLSRLGLKFADLRDLGPNLGQAPITTVRHNLQRYTNQQFLLEFFANAEDAKATGFSVALNLVTVRDKQDMRVLSPTMAYLCKLPSLVIHNDAQFSTDDFEGICHTSIGGKGGRTDTIGEFGLGALTMYHFADVVMIISGGRVLFMDPSKKHLPLDDYASLNLSLKHVQQFYKDHLVPLDGLFGFNIADLESGGDYNGTMFVLPLRTSVVQAESAELCPEFIVPVFWPPARVVSDILHPFQKSALDCLLFTNIQNAKCVTREENSALTTHWSFLAVRTPTVPETGSAYQVTDVQITNLSGYTATWKIALSKALLPEEFHSLKLRRDPFAGLAVRFDRASPDSEGSSFNFFSTLPLSTPTSLPMHVMASFMLSSDRRQIRLDAYEKLPSEYNTWLLAHVVPPLYLFFLEHLLLTADEHFRQRWPVEKDDILSQHVVRGFYSVYLRNSTRRVFHNLCSPPQTLTPQEAVFSGGEPQGIRRALHLLQSPCIVDLPSGPRLLAEESGLAKVSPTFVKDEILRNPEAITSEDDFELLDDIIHYLAEEAKTSHNLCGLPILPLQNESFGTLDTTAIGPTYFVWRPKDQTREHFFAKDRFVHPKMKTKELLKLNINVFPLDPASIRKLLDIQLSSLSEAEPLAQVNWKHSFWSSWPEYSALGLTHNDISSYPLVPTTRSLSFVSLDNCREGIALLVSGDSTDSRTLGASFQALGLNVIRVDSEQTPEPLRSILERKEFPSVTFQIVLAALAQNQQLVTELFLSLDEERKNAFAHWAIRNIHACSDHLLPLARELPIWLSAGNGEEKELRPASEISLLPKGLVLDDAADFMRVLVTDNPALQVLHSPTLSAKDIAENLRLPAVFDIVELQAYKRFFEKWILELPPTYTEPIPVPTGPLTLRFSNELYRRHSLFEAVFGLDSPNFVHPEFTEFEDLLYNRGLRRGEDLDVNMFTEFVQALDMNDPDVLSRAMVIFRAYTQILPFHVTPQERHVWSQLDDLTFVPRRMTTVRKLADQGENESGLDIPANVTALDTIVQPNELVREEFEAVAWSQRAFFLEQPDRRVLVEYPNLGTPNFSEVMAHLRYLSNLSTSNSVVLRMSQRQILINDLQETYRYLNDNMDLLGLNAVYAEQIVSQLRNESLFLNVDDPDDEWVWLKGDSLAFDCGHDEGSIVDVRNFLLQYDKILAAARVPRVHHPKYILSHDALHSESTRMQDIRIGFDKLRKTNTLTDVSFITAGTVDYPNPEPLVAHRCFLAAVSDYFRDLFGGDFEDSHRPVDVRQYSKECIQSVLEYVYTGHMLMENPTLQLLLETLAVSNYWHILDLLDDVQHEIVRRRFIDPLKLDLIREAAEAHNAVGLLNACKEYEEENSEYFQRLPVPQPDDLQS